MAAAASQKVMALANTMNRILEVGLEYYIACTAFVLGTEAGRAYGTVLRQLILIGTADSSSSYSCGTLQDGVHLPSVNQASLGTFVSLANDINAN